MHTTNFVNLEQADTGRIQHAMQTAYFDVGTGDIILFVHGFSGSKLDFRDQLEWFSNNHRAVAYDQRGHGESSNVGPYNFTTMSNDLLHFMDAIQIERCHLLGHSLGGMVAIRALLAAPERFSSAILMDTSPYAIDAFDKNTRHQINDMVMDQGCDALLPNIQSQRQTKAVRRGIDFLGETEHWRRIKVKLEQMDPKAFVDLSYEITDQDSILAQLSTCTLPTSVIVGKDDKPFKKAARDIARTMPNATLVKIRHAAHCPQYENASSWRDAINIHLAQHSL